MRPINIILLVLSVLLLVLYIRMI